MVNMMLFIIIIEKIGKSMTYNLIGDVRNPPV